MPAAVNVPALLEAATRGIDNFLQQALRDGKIDETSCRGAAKSTLPNLRSWLEDPELDRISPHAKAGIAGAIERGEWESLVNAFRRSLSFGTGGIRGMMAFDRGSIERLRDEGLDAPILKGPNTLNNLVLLRVSSGVARFGREKGFSKIVIGYDSRIRGGDFGRAIAELFLAFGFTVYLFDEPCPYPEVTFAIPYREIKADIGLLISASHNDYRYNGYKLSSANGSQFDPQQRDEMYNNYITKAKFSDVKCLPLDQAPAGKLIWLGGPEPLEGVDYLGRPLLNLHERHRDHLLTLLVDANRVRQRNQGDNNLNIGYCAYHGAGRKAVPRLLADLGFADVRKITRRGLYDLNGFFPAFPSDPGKERQPDPGDERAAETAVAAFKEEFGEQEWERTDIILGTDPDADRCGVIVKVPPPQRHLYGGRDYYLLPADDAWALILWYRLQAQADANGGVVPEAQRKFIVQSVPTSDSIVRIARKFGLGAMKTWVGFANLAAGTNMAWSGAEIPRLVEGRLSPSDMLCHPFICETEGMDGPGCDINVAAMEQSNGFSILGGPPPDERSLGTNGHVRDKDGTFAAMLLAEIAADAKAQGTSLLEMVDRHIYLDPAVGLFVNLYEPDPMDGEYPGIQGDRKKNAILRRTLALFQLAKVGGLTIGSLPVQDAVIHRTGKYDHVYPPTYDFQFPDEGIRFYFDDERLNWALVRPSGTGNSMRIHVQMYSPVDAQTLATQKGLLRTRGQAVVDDLRAVLKAPRSGD